MAIINKESTQVSNGNSYNVITSGTKIVGKINSDSDFRLDGEIEGDIICTGKVVIGQRGILKGSITCVCAEVMGVVVGNIKVGDTLTLRSSASVTGDVSIKSLMVEPNAVFNGSCSMKDAANTSKNTESKE
ncbi:MAG: polymer-forming cytoskeletal protein [Paludibacteraceae bacterium]